MDYDTDVMLQNISNLPNNWNNNGAKSFPACLIQKCKDIVDQLSVKPLITPTACDSIQFEYELDNGDYLEFEIYEDKIVCYQIIEGLDTETEVDAYEVIKLVEEFFKSESDD